MVYLFGLRARPESYESVRETLDTAVSTVRFPDARHGAAYRTGTEAYEAMLLEFVEDNFGLRSSELPEASDVDSNPGSP